jgi:hypothetical protein
MMIFSVVSLTAFFQVSSYGFLFSVERGSSDIYAILFAWLFLYALNRRPDRIWLQALLLSCAINIKLTPAILCVLLFWKHRWRCVVPLIVINTVLLPVWGPDNVLVFLKAVVRTNASPDGWWGDHSAYSFAYTVLRPLGYDVKIAEKILICAVLAQWVAGVVILWRRGFSAGNSLLLFATSVPVMMLLPNCSNDYKLVLLSGPLIVFMVRWFGEYAYRGNVKPLVLLGLQLMLMACLGGSGGLVHHSWAANKFPFIFMTGLLMLIEIARSPTLLTLNINGTKMDSKPETNG